MEETKLRKYEYALVISGVGVIAFGLWSIVKAAIYFILIPLDELGSSTQMLDEMGGLQSLGLTDRETGYLIAAAALFALLVDFVLRLYVGRSAVIDGRRLKKKRFAYVIWAMFIAAGLVLSVITRAVEMGLGKSGTWDYVIASANVSVVVDLTSLLAVIEMIVAAIMVRRLRRELGISRKEGA